MSNTYLEKIALNAFKAHAMAKKVGVIPDPSSPWKYALRKLRDSRGEPLQGKALQEGRIALGDISHNVYNQVAAKSRKLASNTELAEKINSSRAKLNASKIDPSFSKVGPIRGNELEFEGEHTLHTHPAGSRISNMRSKLDTQVYRTGKGAHRLSSPSGFEDYAEKNPLSPLERKEHFKRYQDSVEDFKEKSSPKNRAFIRSIDRTLMDKENRVTKVQGMLESVSDNNHDKAGRIDIVLGKLQAKINTLKNTAEGSSPKPFVPPTFDAARKVQTGGDMSIFNERHTPEPQRIVAPSVNTVSVTHIPPKPSFKKPKLFYFDHTARKAKT